MRAAGLVGLLIAAPAWGRDGFVYIPPPPARVAHRADAVVVGTVVAVEPVPRAVLFPATHWAARPAPRLAPVVRVRVDDCWLGRPPAAEVRVALDSPPAVGTRRLYLLGPPDADGLRRLVPHIWQAVSTESAEGRATRHACRAVADPLAGLTAATHADRYRAAAALVNRWTDADGWGSGPQPVFERVPDELVQLALRAVADWPDWSAPPDGADAPDLVLWRLGMRVWEGYAAPNPRAGWSWPAPPWPPFDDSVTDEEVSAWVRDAGEWGFDLRWLPAVVRRAYDAANRPTPPAPLPPTADPLADLIAATEPLIGWSAVERIGRWRAARYPQAAFRLWLEGAGRRYVLHTTDGNRPSVRGEWRHRPGTGLPAGGGWVTMRAEVNR